MSSLRIGRTDVSLSLLLYMILTLASLHKPNHKINFTSGHFACPKFEQSCCLGIDKTCRDCSSMECRRCQRGRTLAPLSFPGTSRCQPPGRIRSRFCTADPASREKQWIKLFLEISFRGSKIKFGSYLTCVELLSHGLAYMLKMLRTPTSLLLASFHASEQPLKALSTEQSFLMFSYVLSEISP